MRFPLIDRCALPCVFAGVVPGRQHADGRRYLPLLLLRLPDPGPDTITPAGMSLGVVDRHHRVAEALAGRSGVARLVFALSVLKRQRPPFSLGLLPELARFESAASLAPVARARVLEVAAWEERRGDLPYEALYAELLLDIGAGTVGLRTTLTAASLKEALGQQPLQPGDWIELQRSRIDILAFEPVQGVGR